MNESFEVNLVCDDFDRSFANDNIKTFACAIGKSFDRISLFNGL